MRTTRLLLILTLLQLSGVAFAGESGAEAPAVTAPQSASAAEIERLRKIILEEQEVVANCMKRIDSLETTKTSQDKALINNLKLNGDFRYRLDAIHKDPETFNTPGVRGLPFSGDQTKNRLRHRLRLRLGFEYTINDQVSVVGRIATTMGGDPVSYNQTLDDAFSKKDLWLDMAYFDYHPKAIPGLKMRGGKMDNPFYTPGKTQMIWDQDLTPEGVVASWTNTLVSSPTGPVFRQIPWEFTATAGYFLVKERSIDAEAQMLGVQGIAKYNFTEDGSTSLLGGLSYYDYGHVKNYPPLWAGDATNTFGNTLNALGVLAGTGLFGADFNIFEAFTEFQTPVFGRPWTLYGDFATNTAEVNNCYYPNNGHIAWALGTSYGRCVTPNSWAVRYEYRSVDRDSVVGTFSDSDFGGGGTGVKGHAIGAEYMLLKNTQLKVTYFINQQEGSDLLRLVPTFGGTSKVDGAYNRLQVDLNFKF